MLTSLLSFKLRNEIQKSDFALGVQKVTATGDLSTQTLSRMVLPV
jgi:hypothetical protein